MQVIKKPLSILLALVMILSVFTVVPVVSAGAAETAPIPYVNAAGEDMGTKNCTVVENHASAWSNGWYAVMNSRYTANVIRVSGTVNLILCDDIQFDAGKGIDLAPGSHLIIWGQSSGTGRRRRRSDLQSADLLQQGVADLGRRRACQHNQRPLSVLGRG